MSMFKKEIRDAINRHSKENGSNTPDWVLADYLNSCLDAFDTATRQREDSCGKAHDGNNNVKK